jgi:tRNA threonylcarbamoyl adenosine modification protein YeaZ
MTILAIETTGKTCGVCAVRTNEHGSFELLAIHELYRENVHDEQLALLAQQCLVSAELSIDAIDVVAVSAGPGSFTGTRIGLALAKGLCYTNTPRLLLVDTMHAMAEASREVAQLAGTDTISVVVPSHRDLVYLAQYPAQQTSGAMQRSEDDVRLMASADVQALPHLGVVVGPGAALVADHPVSGLTRLSARFVALRAVREIGSGIADFANAQSATPLYRQEFRQLDS